MKYYLCHMQKAGGSSLIEYLSSNGVRNVYIGLKEIVQNLDWIDLKSDLCLIAAHEHYSLPEYINGDFTTIVFLREPSHRIISYWDEIITQSKKDVTWSPRELFSHIADETNPEVILKDPIFNSIVNNQMSRKLGKHYDYSVFHRPEEELLDWFSTKRKEVHLINPCTEEDFEQAKINLETCIVGTYENLIPSITKIFNIMGENIKEIHHTEDEISPSNPLVGHEDLINSYNTYDYQLWERAKVLT